MLAFTLNTRGRSPVCELCTLGTVRGVLSNGHSYRDAPEFNKSRLLVSDDRVMKTTIIASFVDQITLLI